MAKKIDGLSTVAEVVAISNDPPDEALKMSSLINGKIRLLYDEDLSVVNSYHMEMVGGDMANMGWVLVDGTGKVVERNMDPLFGYNVPKMLIAINDLKQ
ncbi:MAG: hypothetical protein ACO3L6_08590 [Dehalococcoidia bacterium]